MGIDLVAGGRNKKKRRTEYKGKDVYRGMLVKLYQYLARRTEASFNRKVLRRLLLSRSNRPPLTLKTVIKHMKTHVSHKMEKHREIAVCTTTVTDSACFYTVPKLTICALHFTETAKAKILKTGGECLTFDQLAIRCPTGDDCVLLQGRRSAREACRHFGPAPGVPHSHTKPYVRSKGRKFGKARGRRKSRGFKV
eukprot:g4259.t1